MMMDIKSNIEAILEEEMEVQRKVTESIMGQIQRKLNAGQYTSKLRNNMLKDLLCIEFNGIDTSEIEELKGKEDKACKEIITRLIRHEFTKLNLPNISRINLDEVDEHIIDISLELEVKLASLI